MADNEFKPLRPQPKQELFLTSQADITFYGGAAGGGKTFAELLAPLINVDDTNFNFVYFRTTRPELTSNGGAWDTSKNIYTRFNAKPNDTYLTWKFPSGAYGKLAALQYDKDVFGYQTSQIPLMMFDEVTQRTKFQFFYMMSRNRKPMGYTKSCWILAAFNPEPGWVVDLLQWWWNPNTGYFIPERSGIVRYFIVENDEEVWVDKDYRDERGNGPKSITFIYANIDDNQILKTNDPGYEANLNAQDHVMKERLLKGNCLITYKGGVFDKEWFKPIQMEDLPKKVITARYWDWAATAVKETEGRKKDPDYTVGAECGTYNGDFYIINIRRYREPPGTIEKKVVEAAEFDGFDTTIAWEQGKAEMGRYNTHYLSGKLLGYKISPDPIAGSKIERARPFAIAAQHGHVYYVTAPWNKEMFVELGQFVSENTHDDIVDALSGCFKVLTQQKTVWPTFSISKCVNIKINWNEGSNNILHYGAFHQTPDNSLYFLAALWDNLDGILYVYAAKKYNNIVPEDVALNTIRIMNMRNSIVNKLLASDGILTDKKDISKYINQALRKAGVTKSLSSPVLNDRNGSIVYMNAMYSSESVVVNKAIREAAAQFSGWMYRDDGKQPVEGYGYCETLCLIASELKREISRKSLPPPEPDYHPVKR
ncbi:MAG: terminase family protein, partial [Candidatus Paceibacterota bacterium]